MIYKQRALHLGILFLLTITLMFWSWHQWADPIIDAGNNFYSFWQISEGKALYAEVPYYHGPISPLICGWLFQLFGQSIMVLALANIALIFILSSVLYAILARACDWFTGLAAASIFLCIFAFSQYAITANYNFVLPYKFEAVHGTLSIALMLYFLTRVPLGRRYQIAFAGLCFGAALLTSFEIVTTAVFLALIGFLILILRLKIKLISIFFFLSAAFIFPLLAFGIIARSLSFFEALQRTFNAVLVPFAAREFTKNQFFIYRAGLDDVKANSIRILLHTFAVGLAVVFVLGISRLFPRWMERWVKGLIFLLMVSFFLGSNPYSFDYSRAYSEALPISCLLFCVLYFRRILIHGDDLYKNFVILLLGVWSLVFLAKIFFKPSIAHYGFFLAMPASIFLFTALREYFPNFLKRRNCSPVLLRTFVTAGFVLLILLHFRTSSIVYSKKNLVLGTGKDSLLTWDEAFRPEAFLIGVAASWAEKNIPPSSKLLTVPEGSMINYLARRLRPNGGTLNVAEILILGENKLLQKWESDPPDYIALVHRDLQEFGLPPFGTSEKFGKRTMEWINKNYVIVRTIGAKPFTSNNFGVEFRKISSSSKTSNHL